MDNVKIFVAKLWKQRFWVLASTISLFLVIFLLLVTSGLRGSAKERSDFLDAARNKILRVTSIPNHPNEQFHEEQEEINRLLENAVGDAWEQKWEDQKGILVWPEILGLPFLGIVEPLRPIERNFPLVPDQNWEEPLRVHQRVAYADYISEELPGLAETVRATWNVPTDTRNNEELGMVHWDPANQQEIQDEYFQWPKRRNRQPTTLDVLYAQEDLWVLKALTHIIAETNRDSDARHNLIIKDINFIQIGRMAGMPASDIMILAPTKEEEESLGIDLETPDNFGSREMDRGSSSGVEEDHPAEGRYVNKDYLPLPAQLLWEAGESNEAETAYLAVAKRMPIRIGLVMDQREINRLLIACGNSPLTVEVRQVRINTDSSSTSSGTTNLRGESNWNVSDSGTSQNDEGIVSNDIPIEIYGIIYVFNPVDNPKLRPEESGSEAEVQENASPEQPSPDQIPADR